MTNSLTPCCPSQFEDTAAGKGWLCMRRSIGDKWARDYDECVSCHTTQYPHACHGLCRHCYMLVHNKQWKATYRARHPERVAKERQLYYQNNRRRIQARSAKWCKEHPERLREGNRLRKRLERIISPDTPELAQNRRFLFETVGQCMKCGATTNLEIHHILARLQAGPHILDNLQLLCHKCHRESHGCDMGN